MTAFKVLLHHYTNQEDIIVGSPIAGRNRIETESLIGFFVNMLALRTQLEAGQSFRDLLQQVREVVLTAYDHQDIPFEQLVEELQPERNLSRSPIFSVAFALENNPISDFDLGGIKVTPSVVRNNTAKLDLTVVVSETETGIKVVWEYSTDLFSESTLQRMMGHFQTLLAGIVTNPQQEIGQLPLITPDERYQLLEAWNNTQTEYPQDLSIHQLFEEQVRTTPDAIAVKFKDQQLTYNQLNQQANQLARYLQSLGVQPEEVVGICVERSLETVVGILAILKAGGAYLPIDPEYPPERIAYMLDDAAVKILLTQQDLLTKLPDNQTQIICLERDRAVPAFADRDKIEQQSQDNLKIQVPADNLAYVIYTSGSTGKPKGVQVVHRAVNRLVLNTNYIDLKPGNRIAQVSNPSFDAATFEIWGALLNGATLAIISRDITLSPQQFAQALRQEQIDVMFITTALFNLMSSEVIGAFAGLQSLLFGGEISNPGLIKKVLENSPPERLLHVYGPTENTTFTCWYEITQSNFCDQSTPIGKAISNTQVYILDSNLQPVPVGVAGELYIGGNGLARGYLNRPELTEERFIPNPLIEVRSISPSASPAPPASSAPYSLLPTPYSLLYKTGDLARYLPDGNIEFIGRIDNQVKIRGFRIELGEIETALAQHPDILQNTVIVRQDNPGDKQLVAYIVPNQDISSNNLRSYLQEKLPSYMIPTAFVQLEQMPLTPNGKINRKALPAPDYSVTEIDFTPPTTPTQQQLAQIWSQILKLDHIGIHNNFFELGGHSLLATQIISRIRQELAIELPIRTIFESPTINQLAEKIETENQTVDSRTIQPVTKKENLPLSFAQQRLWFLAQLEPDSYVYNIPIAHRLTGKLNFAALEQSLRAIIARHESLRTNFLVKDGQPTQIIHNQIDDWQLTTTNLEHLSPEAKQAQVENITTQQAQQPFNLTQDCLFRAQLLILDKEEHILLLSMHHIISDGWSMNLLWSELIALYQAFSNNQTSPLSSLPIQYLDFAVWQRQWLQEEVIESELNYWKQQLAGHLPLLELPLDYSRPPVQTHKGAYQTISIPHQLSQSLEGLAQKEGVTLFMLLLAAYQTLLHRYTGQSDIIVGSPIAGRNRAETEGLIGFFVNMLPLRTQVEAEQNFPELLQQVKETVLAAYDHQNLPFEKLVEELQPERNLSHSPIFQVSFNLVNTPSTELELPGIKTTPVEVKTHTAKLDLALALSQTSEGLEGVVEYNTDLFKAETINRLIGHFLTLLEAITVDTEENIARLPILTAAEEHQLLVEWNDTKAEYPNLCIHQLFERQVEKTPEAVAVRFEEQELTYAQLNQKANQLAHYLQSLGVKPGSLVGICVARSIEMIIALLGILKAGGAYVPIDPTYPSDRIDYMLDDSQVSLLVTTEKLKATLPDNQADLICLDTDWSLIAQCSSQNAIALVQPDNLAYIIYTSGSTGKPKGVQIEHRGLTNFLTSMQQKPGLSKTDKLVAVTTISFDIAALELYLPLIVGAEVIIVSREVASDARQLWSTITNNHATVMQATPATWRMLLSIAWQYEQPLKILCGGEALPQELAQQLLATGSSSLESLRTYRNNHLVGSQADKIIGCYLYWESFS